jgi:hypothetical protein
MRSTLLSAVTAALATAQLCAAQTYTSCNPTEKSEFTKVISISYQVYEADM